MYSAMNRTLKVTQAHFKYIWNFFALRNFALILEILGGLSGQQNREKNKAKYKKKLCDIAHAHHICAVYWVGNIGVNQISLVNMPKFTIERHLNVFRSKFFRE